MRVINLSLAAALALGSTAAFAATQFEKHCAWGLSQGKKVKTDCSDFITDNRSGKTYCFSNNQVKYQFFSNYDENIKAAEKTFGRS
jgi:YHS domain-containing protein